MLCAVPEKPQLQCPGDGAEQALEVKVSPRITLLLQSLNERSGGGGGALRSLERPCQEACWLQGRIQFETLPPGFTLRLLLFLYLLVKCELLLAFVWSLYQERWKLTAEDWGITAGEALCPGAVSAEGSRKNYFPFCIFSFLTYFICS